ncbi:MAG: flagellar export protein FliJ [Acetivibrionales bacterium]|jgi:flagellar FliJ protein
MARFTFKLQPVLNVRKQQEDNIKNKFGKAVRKLEAEKQKLAELVDTLDVIVDEFNDKTRKTTVQKLILYNGYLSLLGTKIKRQKVNVNKASLNVDKIREELIFAMKERKIMEKLKEKKYEMYLDDLKAAEQKTNDDLAGYMYINGIAGE